MPDPYKISVISPSFNQAGFIERTIQSVLDQQVDFPMEYIIMDGGSTDGTVDILEKYSGKLKWFSEKDEGQADAVNKGIRQASGEIIGWLNSDDLYLPGTLQKIIDFFSANPSCQWVIGKCCIIDENDRPIRKGVTAYKNLFLKRFRYNALLVENFISQPAVFFRKSAFISSGYLALERPLAMDYDLWLRLGKQFKPGLIRDELACFRVHPGAKSKMNAKSQFLEQVDIHKDHDRRSGWLFLHRLNAWKNIAGYLLIDQTRRFRKT